MFVHGTGVREPAYRRSLRTISQNLTALRPDLTVSACFWGGPLGSTLRMGGCSIPDYRPAAMPRSSVPGPERPGANAMPPADSEDTLERERWDVLYRDPLFELELLRMTGSAGPRFVPSAETLGEEMSRLARQLVDNPEVQDAFTEAGFGSQLQAALLSVLTSETCRDVLAELDEDAGGARTIIARAVVAHAISHTEDGPISVSPADRNAMLAAVIDGLGGTEYGIGGAVARVLKASSSIALRFGGSRWVVSRRNTWTEEAHLFAGDILYYLARGKPIREFIARRIREADGPVVLLAHSLGGIAAVDLLAEQALPEVELLVTVGSQAPLLYEFDALPCLPFGHELPNRFPAWLNIFDRRDLLSYVGHDVFPGRVVDHEVDNGQGVNTAHSAYWNNHEVYELLAQKIVSDA
jgi:hypothetical protein